MRETGIMRGRGVGIGVVVCLLICFAGASAVSARETFQTFPVKQALEKAERENRLLDVALYFGDQKHPKVIQNMGEWATNKKTNAFGKSDRVACDWVFISAILQMQQRALQEGGNAVINIKSNYKNIEFVSDDEYRCGAGNIMAGVALLGTVVKIEK